MGHKEVKITAHSSQEVVPSISSTHSFGYGSLPSKLIHYQQPEHSPKKLAWLPGQPDLQEQGCQVLEAITAAGPPLSTQRTILTNTPPTTPLAIPIPKADATFFFHFGW